MIGGSKMKKDLAFIIVIITLFLLCMGVVAIFSTNSEHKEKEKKETEKKDINYIGYHINYYVNNSMYDIVPADKYIVVDKYEVIQCITYPCDPKKEYSFPVKYTKEYKELFQELFQNNQKEVTLREEQLNNNQKKTLNTMVKEVDTSDLSYEILDRVEGSSDYSKRGYYIEKLDNNKTLVTVSMGTQYTGGYEIDVVGIDVYGKNVQINVKEQSPAEDDIVLQVLTTPITQVLFHVNPDSLLVFNKTTNQYVELIEES